MSLSELLTVDFDISFWN